ncbi:hypothetical protein ACSBR2_003271 [Camellia fascicularis]
MVAFYIIIMQCLGSGRSEGLPEKPYEMLGGGANTVSSGYTKGNDHGAEIMGTFIVVYSARSATDAMRNARDSHVPANCQILAPLPIGFAVFLVHLATIPITGRGINPARGLGAAIVFNRDKAWNDHVSLHL